MEIRKSEERGVAEHGWLSSRHSFSFASYLDPRHMGFGPLRVINEDRVAPGAGFDTHGHRDMEIISYVLEGALEHKDSMGTGSVIRYGQVQRMSAGSGVTHSEFNHSQTEPVHFLQIWIQPKFTGIRPGYEEKQFDRAAKKGQWCLIAAPDGQNDAVTIHQDAHVYASIVDGDDRLEYAFEDARCVYVHVALGSVKINGVTLHAGDAAKFTDPGRIEVCEGDQAEILLFDLPRAA